MFKKRTKEYAKRFLNNKNNLNDQKEVEKFLYEFVEPLIKASTAIYLDAKWTSDRLSPEKEDEL